MPRKIRDASLDTRTARSRLVVRHKPFFRLIEPGLHLGYRKLTSGPGTWLVRRYGGEGRYTVANLRTADGEIVLADDFADADGRRVLSFAQAQRQARGPRAARSGDYTVSDALDAYLHFLEGDGRSPYSVQDARYRIEALIRPELGRVKLAALSTERLRAWRDKLATTPARVRTARDQQQQHREIIGDDGRRRRRSTANRTWKTLRAALNRAFGAGYVDSDAAWRKLGQFRGVDAARVRYLSVEEARRLINASAPNFRLLVQAALATGARFSELTRLQVADFNSDAGTLAIGQSKSGKPRHVVLTDEGAAFFGQITAGRHGGETMLRRDDGRPWLGGDQSKPMADACKRAGITPPASFHTLRHSWASLAAMGGVPLLVIARNLGHANTLMVEKHYGHLAPSYVVDAIRAGAPRFGLAADNVVKPLVVRR